MTDQKGSFYLLESILAVIILLMVILVVNTIIMIPDTEYSYQIHDFKSAQDTMELLSGKVNFTDSSFLEEISDILNDNKNSKKSVRDVSDICQDKLDGFNLENYQFCENNKLDGKVLASHGNYKKANHVSVATRTCGDYSYTLSVW